ncbi:hypothetical protein DL98DRAFT_641363 [Cadophora sp. DSE1049]|nr:hypothetical protein DL98DRAFT_641363 [Cadophora sp. DSE1049]
MSTWVEQMATAPKRKRAGLVCVICHERKIKCDLQNKSADGTGIGYISCSNCVANGQQCRLRPSKRGNPRTSASQRAARDQSNQQDKRQQADEPENALFSPPRSTATSTNEVTGADYSQPPPPLDPHLGAIRTTERSVSVSSPQSTRNKTSETYLGESGFLQVYTQEHRDYTAVQDVGPREGSLSLDLPGADLLQSFSETYFQSCYPFCPVLENEALASDLARSPLLTNALALTASHIQPPFIPSTKSATYYSRAKQMFYNDEEEDPITCLQAICLFYWWSPRPSSHAQRDAAWWWNAVAVRQAQQIGLHRELKPGHSNAAAVNRGLRRRIWWTLFARERLTAICQSRPCLIDPEDCNIPDLTLDDFPDPTNPKAEVFIYWVKLCAIIGRVAKYRSRVTDVASLAFPAHLANELVEWIHSLPQHLKLPLEVTSTTTFNRDVHQLHLPYLAVIVILHLSPSNEALPSAYAAAVMAASCIARIFKNYLARGGIRFLMPVSGWICGIATLALLRASRIQQLTQHAEDDINILVIALKELRVSYPVADMFLQGFERLRSENAGSRNEGALNVETNDSTVGISNGVDWIQYFPNVTAQTSGLAKALLSGQQEPPFLDEAWLASMPLQLEELFGSYEDFSDMPIF